MTPADKVLENRLRRTLARRGYALVKSRMRDPKGIGHGGYLIAHDGTNDTMVARHTPNDFSMTLADVQRWAEDG